MRKYEIVYIIKPDFDEEKYKEIVEKYSALVQSNGGEVLKVDPWGKRRLAYPIHDLNEGYYVLITFTSGPELPAELDRILKITDGIMRSLITCRDE